MARLAQHQAKSVEGRHVAFERHGRVRREAGEIDAGRCCALLQRVGPTLVDSNTLQHGDGAAGPLGVPRDLMDLDGRGARDVRPPDDTNIFVELGDGDHLAGPVPPHPGGMIQTHAQQRQQRPNVDQRRDARPERTGRQISQDTRCCADDEVRRHDILAGQDELDGLGPAQLQPESGAMDAPVEGVDERRRHGARRAELETDGGERIDRARRVVFWELERDHWPSNVAPGRSALA